MENINIQKVLILSSAVMGLLPFAIYIACWLFQIVWAWIDDGVVGHRNIFIKWLCLKSGYRVRDSTVFPYYTKSGELSEGVGPFLIAVICFFLTPFFIFACFRFLFIPITILIVALIAHVCRYTRRISKKMTKHLKDTKIHNNK